MLRRIIILSLMILLLVNSAFSIDKAQPRIKKIGDVISNEIRVRPSLSLADTCIVRHDQGIHFQIDGWVIGNELYKSYLDPSLSCTNPYPFTVLEINMPMYFAKATTLSVSVDVEAVNYSNPGCPVPDTIIALSSAWEVTIPNSGLFNIVIPLDSPVVVDGPFFAGFFIGTAIDQDAGVAIITDSIPTASIPSAFCYSYNIWDDTLGFIDLLNNQFWDFPGQLVLYASGIPGGNPGDHPEPIASILAPYPDEILMGSTDIWVQELSGSGIIDYVAFEYSFDGTNFTEIGRDYDGSVPFRNGSDDAGSGDGFSFVWDFNALSEGVYTFRAKAVDTLGRFAVDDITVYLEPTPPTPVINSPAAGTSICSSFDIIVQNSDENLNQVDFLYKHADSAYSKGLDSLNIVYFENFYSAPIAAGLMVKYWGDNGYSTILFEGNIRLEASALAEKMAEYFETNLTTGNSDDKIYSGLIAFNNKKGRNLIIDYERNPDYMTLRQVLENEERTVMIGLSGTPGYWLAVEGFGGWKQPDGTYPLLVSNPQTSSIANIPLRENAGVIEVNFTGSSWQKIDLMITMIGRDWVVDKNIIGSDLDNSDGWSYFWTPVNLAPDNYYYIIAEGTDVDLYADASSVMLKYDCSNVFVKGDFTDDGNADIVDLNYLIDYFINNGPQPTGGEWRADTNCDNYINITDIVFFTNYIFGTSAPPCH